MRVYGGIDPGLSGGMALLNYSGIVIGLSKMPETERDVLETLGEWLSLAGGGGARDDPAVIHVSLERVHAMPKQGVSSTFKFGMGYGGLRMALVASGIPFDEVIPRKWQGALGCLTQGDKNVSKRRAQELFPGVKVTHALADALLLAEYGRRQHRTGDERRRSIRDV